MNKRFAVFAIIIFLAAAAGCNKTSRAERDQQAIRAAVQKHLSERGNLNMAGMEVEVKKVTTQENRAEAQVEFRAKQGGASMQMTYNLERQGDAWVVRGGRPAVGDASHPPMGGGMPPAGMGELPPAHPPLGAPGQTPGQSGAGALPQGHPPLPAEPGSKPALGKASPPAKK